MAVSTNEHRKYAAAGQLPATDGEVASPALAAARLPVEARVLAVFAAIFLLGLALGLPLNLPDGPSLAFVHKHYFGPLLVAFALQLPVAYLAGRRRAADPLLMVKLLPFLALTILLHFNFKAWMPLVNPLNYDPVFQRVDEVLWPVLQLFAWLRATIADLAPVDVDSWYHGLFVGMFFVSISAHALFDRPQQQRRLVLGLCLVLLLGGVAYWAMPALGPFLYRAGLNAHSSGAQQHMLNMFNVVVTSGELPAGYFTAPLAAMPSLHVAHALFFTLFAWRSLRWLGVLYLPLLGWIVIESVASSWHYLIDLPVGAALALLCLSWVNRLLPDADVPS